MSKINEPIDNIISFRDANLESYRHDNETLHRKAAKQSLSNREWYNDGLVNSHLVNHNQRYNNAICHRSNRNKNYNSNKEASLKYHEPNKQQRKQSESFLSTSTTSSASSLNKENHSPLHSEEEWQYESQSSSEEKEESACDRKRKRRRNNKNNKHGNDNINSNIFIDNSQYDDVRKKCMSCDILGFIDAAVLHNIPEHIIVNYVQVMAKSMQDNIEQHSQINSLAHHSRVMAFEMCELLNYIERTNLALEHINYQEEEIQNNKEKLSHSEEQEYKLDSVCPDSIKNKLENHSSFDQNLHHNNNSGSNNDYIYQQQEEEKQKQAKAKAVLFIRRQKALPEITVDTKLNKVFRGHSAPSIEKLITRSGLPENEEEESLREHCIAQELESEQKEHNKAVNKTSTVAKRKLNSNAVHWQPSHKLGNNNKTTTTLTPTTEKNILYENVVAKRSSHVQPILLSRPVIHRSTSSSEHQSSKANKEAEEEEEVRNKIATAQGHDVIPERNVKELHKYYNTCENPSNSEENKKHNIAFSNNNESCSSTAHAHPHRLCETCAIMPETKANLKELQLASNVSVKHHMLPTQSSLRMHREKYRVLEEEQQEEKQLQYLEKKEEYNCYKEAVKPLACTSIIKNDISCNNNNNNNNDRYINFCTQPSFRYKPVIPVRETHSSQLRFSRSRSNCNTQKDKDDNYTTDNIIHSNESDCNFHDKNLDLDEEIPHHTMVEEYHEQGNTLIDKFSELLHKTPLRQAPCLPVRHFTSNVLQNVVANTMHNSEFNDHFNNDTFTASPTNNTIIIDDHNTQGVYSDLSRQALKQAIRESKEKMQNADRLLQRCNIHNSLLEKENMRDKMALSWCEETLTVIQGKFRLHGI